MTTPTNFVLDTTYSFTPTTERVSETLWTVFLAVNKVHSVWRTYRQYYLYTRPESMAQLFAGYELANAIEEHYFLRVAAKTLLIATRILESVQALSELNTAYIQWKDAISGNYTPSTKIQWSTSTTKMFSPSTVIWWNTKVNLQKEHIHRIAMTSLALAWCLIHLSMRVLDVIDTINWTPQMNREAATHTFVNIGIWIEAAASNKKDLLDKLEGNKHLVEHILGPTALKYEDLHEKLSVGLTVAENVNFLYKLVFNPFRL